MHHVYVSEEDLRELKPWLLPPSTPNLTKAARLFGLALRDQTFLTGRVGVLVYDIPSFRHSADRVLLPSLREAGAHIVDVFYANESTAQDQGLSMSSAVLRFSSQGVDRVVIWDSGIIWSEFAKRADAQRYYPRYGIQSLLVPDAGLPPVPPAQRRGTVAAGWLPATDVSDRQFPLTGRERECFAAINRRAGTNLSRRSMREGESTNPQGPTALALCQFLEMMRVALAPATGKPLAQADVWGYVSALGSEPPVVTPPQTFFSPEDWDGADRYAHLAYNEGCDCFQYTSDWRKIP